MSGGDSVAAAALRHPAPGPVAGLDPGRSKCGLVLTDPRRTTIREALVLPPEQARTLLLDWQRAQALRLVVIGNGTGSGAWLPWLGDRLEVVQVEERDSTLAARRRYWQLFPPRGWRRLLPEGLLQPPRDWDDVVAQLLHERWLGRLQPREPGAGSARLRTRPAP